jgi:hypothetical protein
MKQLINFRFDARVLASLEVLAQHLQCSKTRIVEEAILRYAEEKQLKRSGLFSLAGSIPENDADDILNTIRDSKNRKEFPGTL